MEINIRARGFDLDDETRDMILRRTTFALDAFTDSVGAVSIYLLDLNGPRGGVDKLCQINAEIGGRTQLAVIEQNRTIAGAVNQALRSMKYRVADCLRREREHEPESMAATVS